MGVASDREHDEARAIMASETPARDLAEALYAARLEARDKGARMMRDALLQSAVDFETRHSTPTIITMADGKAWEPAEEARQWRVNALMLGKLVRAERKAAEEKERGSSAPEWLVQLINDVRSFSHELSPGSETHELVMRVRLALADLARRVLL